MWLVPSKGRPHLARRLFEAAAFKEPGVLILEAREELEYREVRPPANWRRMVVNTSYLSEVLNRAVTRYPDESWYGILNDDHLPKTEGWERAIVAAALEHHIAWPHDNYAKRISCHAKSGALVRVLGWFVCPAMRHFYLDDVDELIAAELGGRFLPEVVVSHEHVNAGRMAPDRTYMERPSNGADRAAWLRWKEHGWPDVKERLMSVKNEEGRWPQLV